MTLTQSKGMHPRHTWHTAIPGYIEVSARSDQNVYVRRTDGVTDKEGLRVKPSDPRVRG